MAKLVQGAVRVVGWSGGGGESNSRDAAEVAGGELDELVFAQQRRPTQNRVVGQKDLVAGSS